MGYLSATLASRDVKAAIDFYVGSLGFELGTTFPSAENPEYADVSKDGMVLMFIPAADAGIGPDEKLGTGVSLYMQIDGVIDEYYDEIKKRGVKIAVDIKDEPYGIRDFTVEDADGYKLIFNQVSQSAETCGGCDTCVTCMTSCLSCGMPLNGPDDFGGGDPENKYCVHCANPDGSLKSYDEVLNGMVNFMMESRKMDKDTAETIAREYIATMPAWNNNS